MAGLLFLPLLGLSIIISSAYLVIRWKWQALIFFFPFLVYLFWIGDVQNIPFFLVPLIIGGIGGYSMRSGKSFTFFLVLSTLSGALIMSGVFYYLLLAQKIDFYGTIRAEMLKFFTLYKAPPDMKQEMLKYFDKNREYIAGLVPFSSFLNLVILAGISFVFLKKVSSRITGLQAVKGLEFFKLNEYLIFLFIVAWGSYFLIDNSHYYLVHIIALNTGLILSVFYFIQALGIIKFIMIKRGIPLYILPLTLSVMFIFGIALFLFFFVFLTGLGTLDLWADFRKLNLEKDKSGTA